MWSSFPIPQVDSAQYTSDGRNRVQSFCFSDVRDGTTMLELDPDLVIRRLGLPRASKDLCERRDFLLRGFALNVGIFHRIWRQISSCSAGRPPNEQDILNQELAAGAGGVQRVLLPPAAFQNGFVHHAANASPADVVLVHANWIDGIAAKIYHLREAGLWAESREPSDSKSCYP